MVSQEPIAYWVERSHVVAEVEVLEVRPLMFNTPSGEMPTPNASRIWDGLELYSPIVLHVTQYYRGAESGNDGFVVPMLGGSSGGFTYTVDPEAVFEVGKRGVVFLSLEHEDSEVSYPAGHWIDHLRAVANELSTGGDEYQPATVVNFYEFYDGEGVENSAFSRFDLVGMHKEDLVYEINEAASGP